MFFTFRWSFFNSYQGCYSFTTILLCIIATGFKKISYKVSEFFETFWIHFRDYSCITVLLSTLFTKKQNILKKILVENKYFWKDTLIIFFKFIS